MALHHKIVFRGFTEREAAILCDIAYDVLEADERAGMAFQIGKQTTFDQIMKKVEHYGGVKVVDFPSETKTTRIFGPVKSEMTDGLGEDIVYHFRAKAQPKADAASKGGRLRVISGA